MLIDRRRLILTGTLGLGAYAIPGFAQTAGARATGFTHGVASGEPASDSMLFWTRFVPTGGDNARVRLEVSEGEDFVHLANGGETVTGPWRDHTVKITVAGLKPGTDYFYRFVSPTGGFSPIGRTKTLPAGDARQWKAAVFSCSNLPYGYFNAYAHAAVREDIDCAIHLGDYFYEYEKGGYAPPGGAVDGRWPEPVGEIVHLADYRLRHASYRADPDLQRLHQEKPMIVQWDDHESTNDSWEGGAQNHQPDKEGDWGARKSAAIQAYREWMPVSDEPWKAYDIGTLATLFRTETRLLGRTRQPEVAQLFLQADPATALRQFRDGAWQDHAQTMMGWEQENWIAHAMHASVRAGVRWQVVGFGTIIGEQKAPEAALGWLKPDAPARFKAYVQAGVAASRAGLPSNFDNWGGYPAARHRFLGQAQAMGANLICIAGDSHNAWAFDLAQSGKPVGVEFAGQSVTSPGYEGSIGTDPKTVAAALVGASSELKWCDTSRRGYMAMTLTPDRASCDWVFVDTIARRTPAASIGHTATVERGRNVMA